jgi:hypothetical protein
VRKPARTLAVVLAVTGESSCQPVEASSWAATAAVRTVLAGSPSAPTTAWNRWRRSLEVPVDTLMASLLPAAAAAQSARRRETITTRSRYTAAPSQRKSVGVSRSWPALASAPPTSSLAKSAATKVRCGVGMARRAIRATLSAWVAG